MQIQNTLNLIYLTLHSLDLLTLEKIEEDFFFTLILKKNNVQNKRLTIRSLFNKKIIVQNQLDDYYYFTQSKVYNSKSAFKSEEFFSFLQYLKKFEYYIHKFKNNNKEESIYLAMKGLLTIRYLFSNFSKKKEINS